MLHFLEYIKQFLLLLIGRSSGGDDNKEIESKELKSLAWLRVWLERRHEKREVRKPPVRIRPDPAPPAPDQGPPPKKRDDLRELDHLIIADEPNDILACSAFSRNQVKRGKSINVSVAVHLPDQLDEAERLVQRRDPDTELRDQIAHVMRLAPGTPLGVKLEAEGGTVEQPVDAFVWTGEVHISKFKVWPAEGEDEVSIDAFLIVKDHPVGTCNWVVKVQNAETVGEPELLGAFRRFKHSFVSYSRKDRDTVATVAATMNAFEIDFDLDYVNLRTGDEFPIVISDMIQRCDLFLIFWSEHSSKSKWVQREMDQAFARWKASSPRGRRPKLWPIVLQIPYPQPPADWKSQVHFDNIYTTAGYQNLHPATSD